MGNSKTSLLLFFIIISILAFGQDQTIDSLKSAMSKLQESPEKVQMLLRISRNYQSTSLKDAVDYATLARDLSVKIKYDEGIGNSYSLLGNCYKRLGKYSESLDAYSAGLDVFIKMKNLVGQSIILNNFESLYANQGQ